MLMQTASQRVLAIPELLSLIFSFLAHSDLPPITKDEENPEQSSFSLPTCTCSCTQCHSEQYLVKNDLLPPTGQLSLPSPFAIPAELKKTRKGRTDSDEEDDPTELAICHCRLPVHHQLTNLFTASKPRRKTPYRPNKPSYNLNNALVCKTWSPIALDVLWRVVDRPERLFALLDGAWGQKLKSDAFGNSKRLEQLRGLYRDEKGPGRMPLWWKPGVQAFLGLARDEEDDAGESSEDEPEYITHNPNRTIRKREYELFVSSRVVISIFAHLL